MDPCQILAANGELICVGRVPPHSIRRPGEPGAVRLSSVHYGGVVHWCGGDFEF